MSFFINSGISVVGMAAAVPTKVVNVDEYIEIFGEDVVNKFRKKTGIHQMYRTEINQTACDLGYEAAENLIEQLGINRSDIGVLVLVTQYPDYRTPATACVLHNRLKLGIDCSAFDVGQGCSGFVYGHQNMQSMLMNSDAQYGLLVVAETFSKFVDPKNKTIAMMFGDAGTAILYKKDKNTQETLTILESDGMRFKSIITPAGGNRDLHPEDDKFIAVDGKVHSKYKTFMDGLGVFSFSTMDVPDAIRRYLTRNEKQAQNYDYIVFHQANAMIIKQIAKGIKAPLDKILMSLQEYGNTSGATIPLTICKNLAGKDFGSVNILASGFGTGLSWGVTEFSIDTKNILPIVHTDSWYAEGRF